MQARLHRSGWSLALVFIVACHGDDEGGSESATASSTSTTTTTTTSGTTAETTAAETTGSSMACVSEVGAPVYMHAAAVESDQTWPSGVHLVDGALTVTAVLTVEPCSVIKVPANTTVSVRDGGALDLAGTAELPIIVTSEKASPAAGDWNEIDFYATSLGPRNVLRNVIVQYGGAGGYGQVWLEDGASIEIRDSTIRDGGDYGLFAGDVDLRDFSGNTITDNALGPIRIDPNSAGALGVGTYTPNGGAGIVLSGGPVDKDQTWLAHDAPYVVDNNIDVTVDAGSAHLTVEAGATLRLGQAITFRILENGGLTLPGTADAPITITSAKAIGAAGDWGTIEFYSGSADAFNDLDHVILEYGGGAGYGQLWVEDGASVAITDSTIRDGADDGVQSSGTGELRDFSGNTITGNAKSALTISANAVDQLEPGVYGPNGVDGIALVPVEVDHDAEWLSLGVPYLADGGFTVRVDAGSALLTVQAGATIRLGAGGLIRIADNAGLALDGTADAPITVTSAKPAPAPGDWDEIDLYSSSVGPANVFRHTTLEYGGGGIYGQVWVEEGASLTLEDSSFNGAGMACDVAAQGTVNATNTPYTPCP